MDLYTGSVPRKFISLRLESAERQDQPGQISEMVAAQPAELRTESTSGSETSESLSDFFSSMETKHRACANLGLSTSSSKTVTEQSAEKLETPSESALPSLYDVPQPQLLLLPVKNRWRHPNPHRQHK